jgi:4-oxalomesaconate tautomerase
MIICEHPAGSFTAAVEIDTSTNPPTARRSGIVRTARKLMDGVVFPTSL